MADELRRLPHPVAEASDLIMFSIEGGFEASQQGLFSMSRFWFQKFISSLISAEREIEKSHEGAVAIAICECLVVSLLQFPTTSTREMI